MSPESVRKNRPFVYLSRRQNVVTISAERITVIGGKTGKDVVTISAETIAVIRGSTMSLINDGGWNELLSCYLE